MRTIISSVPPSIKLLSQLLIRKLVNGDDALQDWWNVRYALSPIKSLANPD